MARATKAASKTTTSTAKASKTAASKGARKTSAAKAAKPAKSAAKTAKTTAKKTPSRKAAPVKAAPSKSTAKKASPSRAAAKKAATTSAGKKAASSKATTKKSAPAKAAAKASAKPAKSTSKSAAPKAGGKTRNPHFDAKFLDAQRALLLEERATYVRQAASLQAEADALVADFEPGDVQFDEESGEGDTLAVERERDLALSAQARAAVEEIDHALAKLDNGTYGICEISGLTIPRERLKAIPWARERVEYKAAGLSSRR